jgi:phosphoserine phosphatase
VKERKEVDEIKEIKEVEEKSGRVAAFFDLDGTLVALPSLERRLFRTLRYRREIRAKNYLFWLQEALRLMPLGIHAILQGNKMYLRGLQVLDECGQLEGEVTSCRKNGHQAGGQVSSPSLRNPRLPAPTFFAPAIEEVAAHARQGHELMLISGTLDPLARMAARALQTELSARGIAVTIRVIATRLEEADDKFTGRILGEAMFGEAKARAARRLAEEMRLDLGRCYAYGDSLHDRWLMEVVGRPAAVNPSNDLASLARSRGWPVLSWEKEESLTQRRPDRVGTGAVQRQVEEKEEHRSAIA